jgi:hypothetical protein
MVGRHDCTTPYSVAGITLHLMSAHILGEREGASCIRVLSFQVGLCGVCVCPLRGRCGFVVFSPASRARWYALDYQRTSVFKVSKIVA